MLSLPSLVIVEATSSLKNEYQYFRATHVQSFQPPCVCTRMRSRISASCSLDIVNQELKNAFLDESSILQKEENMPRHFYLLSECARQLAIFLQPCQIYTQQLRNRHFHCRVQRSISSLQISSTVESVE